MSASNSRRLNELVGVRLAPGERAQAEALAAAAGITVAELIRRLLVQAAAEPVNDIDATGHCCCNGCVGMDPCDLDLGRPDPDDEPDEHDEEVTTDDDRLGWWAISGAALLDMLRRVQQGEDPDLVYAEEYANSKIERPGEPQ